MFNLITIILYKVQIIEIANNTMNKFTNKIKNKDKNKIQDRV